MRLHVFPPSPRAAKVLALADHLGLDCEIRIVDLFKGEQQKPEYAVLNPNKRMPVLEDAGFVLWESNAILQYLGSKRPESGLWPSEPRTQADVSRWQSWQLAHWGPACGTMIFEHLVKRLTGGGDPSPAEVKKGEDGVKRFGAVLDQSLAGRKYLVGERMTAADISCGVWLTYRREGKLPIEEFKNLQRWYEGLEQLESWKKAAPPPLPGS